jgi:hypothetical protein
MSWFRQHRRNLMQFAPGVRAPAVVITALDGCLVQRESGHALHTSISPRHRHDALIQLTARPDRGRSASVRRRGAVQWFLLISQHLEYAMQTQWKWVLAAILAGSALTASANDEHHPAEAPAGATTASTPDDTAAGDPAMSQMMVEQMQKMQAAHDKAAAAKTPAERQAAMQEGMQAMKEGMAVLSKQQGSAGCMGMSGPSGGMGMMEMMMKMMDQQSSMMGVPTK